MRRASGRWGIPAQWHRSWCLGCKTSGLFWNCKGGIGPHCRWRCLFLRRQPGGPVGAEELDRMLCTLRPVATHQRGRCAIPVTTPAVALGMGRVDREALVGHGNDCKNVRRAPCRWSGETEHASLRERASGRIDVRQDALKPPRRKAAYRGVACAVSQVRRHNERLRLSAMLGWLAEGFGASV